MWTCINPDRYYTSDDRRTKGSHRYRQPCATKRSTSCLKKKTKRRRRRRRLYSLALVVLDFFSLFLTIIKNIKTIDISITSMNAISAIIIKIRVVYHRAVFLNNNGLVFQAVSPRSLPLFTFGPFRSIWVNRSAPFRPIRCFEFSHT